MSVETVIGSSPRSVGELTPQWLTRALRARTPGITVEDVEIVEAIWGTATKVRIRATYAEVADSAGPPRALCVKGGLDKRWRMKAGNAAVRRLTRFDAAGAYRLEAEFYDRLAPVLAAPLPRCWSAEVDAATGQGLVVLDDLVAAGARFGDPTVAWEVDRVAAALEVQAAWQAGSWGLQRSAYPWLPASPIVRELTPILLSAVHWNTHFRRRQAPALPVELEDRRVVAAAFDAMWRRHRDQAACLSHGDAHIGNAYLDADRQPTFFDWQGVCIGPPLDDVSYFITGALSTADRRAHERSLLEHYLAALSAGGAPAPTFEVAWQAYRSYALHGFLWAVTPPLMQPWCNVRAMADRHIAAILELETLSALSAVH